MSPPFAVSERAYKLMSVESIVGLIILLIPLVGYLIFSGFPVVISFIIQFADMDRFDLDSLKWNNFANFSAVFTDGRFWHSIGITLWLLATHESRLPRQAAPPREAQDLPL